MAKITTTYEHELIINTAYDELDLSETTEFILNHITSWHHHPVLWDLSNLEPQLFSKEEIFLFADVCAKITKSRANEKTAIVGSTDFLSRLVPPIANHPSQYVSVQAFHTIESAKEWLNTPVEQDEHNEHDIVEEIVYPQPITPECS